MKPFMDQFVSQHFVELVGAVVSLAARVVSFALRAVMTVHLQRKMLLHHLKNMTLMMILMLKQFYPLCLARLPLM
jgi:hypothetical protein